MNILITGGTGSFGQAFTKFLLTQNLSERICIYSRGEHAQAAMRDRFNDDPRLRFFIGDVRDRDRLVRAMVGVDTVVHSAALKRIETCHYNTDEVIKTNVIGAMNVIDAATVNHVEKVVALSTDKAWGGGVSPYGQSKALAESLFLSANGMYGAGHPYFAVVRYGNIFGAQGSVVPKWQEMIRRGCNVVPVTDPDCTRFMMRISEAVGFVEETLRTMQGGELNIPDWLPAYRVGDLAEAMGVSMSITGLPAWERKHEGMRDGLTSDIVRRLTVDELRGYLSGET